MLPMTLYAHAAEPETGKQRRGVCSNYLHFIRPGDELTMTGPW